MASPAPGRRRKVRYISPIVLVLLIVYLSILWMVGAFLGARFLQWIGYPNLSP